MKYMGSKAKVARYIVPIIQEQIERSGYETYLEPFCGGCNVIDKIEAPQRIASDCNKYLIALMQHIQAGGELPGYIEREEYAKVRANRDDYPHKLANAIEHYGLADKVQNSHRAIDDVLALYEVTKAMSEERDDLTDYIDLLGYNPKYGITGRKLRQITYMPQSYKLGCRLPDLMNGGGSCE